MFMSSIVFECDLVRFIHFLSKYVHILIIFSSMQQFKHPDSNIGLIFVAGSVGTSNLFLYCFFGKLATDSFDNMAYCMYASKWQALPINLQKYFILMIGNMQRPLYYHGFNVAYLNLETFCRVRNLLTFFSLYIFNRGIFLVFKFQLVKAVLSYYMMFKTLLE